jgi:hypothetical protein
VHGLFSAGNPLPDLTRPIAFINPDNFRESLGIFIKRVTINALIDIGCLITSIPSLITGLVLYLILPEGGERGAAGPHILVLHATNGSPCTITRALHSPPCLSSICSSTGSFSEISGGF